MPDESEDEKAFEGWWREILMTDPSVAIVVRGHLLLEEEINLFFEKTLIHPELVTDDKSFTLWLKVRLLRAMQKGRQGWKAMGDD